MGGALLLDQFDDVVPDLPACISRSSMEAFDVIVRAFKVQIVIIVIFG